jgi:hypothetical protein
MNDFGDECMCSTCNPIEITSLDQIVQLNTLTDEQVATCLQIWLKDHRSTLGQLQDVFFRASEESGMIIWRSLNRLQAWSCDELGIED